MSSASERPKAGQDTAQSEKAPLAPAEVLVTQNVAARTGRPPNLVREAAAMQELSRLTLENPSRAVQRFLELAVELCDAGTAGLSLLDTDAEGAAIFRWDALAGELSGFVGGTTPRNFSPCGLCLDAGHAIVLSRPFRAFPYFNAASRPLMEGLVVPLYDTGGIALGTLWVVHHDPDKHFSPEDVRIMGQLAVQLVLALKMRASAADRKTSNAALMSLQEEKAALINSDAFLRSILASSADCIKVLDMEGHILFMNGGGLQVMEIEDFEKFRGRVWSAMWEGDGHFAAIEALESAKGGKMGRFRHPARTAKGTLKHWDVQVTAVLADTGEPYRILAISRDVTEEYEAHEHRRFLMRELEHRIKNMQAITGAIVLQTFRSAETKEEAKATLTGRLSALNQAHEILTKVSWTAAPVLSVVEGALAPYRTGKGRFSISGPDFELDAKPALSLALGLHELAANATKYGSLSNADGKVAISWRLEPEENQHKCIFEWRESGGPPVLPPKRQGFGSRLIESIDKSGSSGILFGSEGVHCSLVIHLDN